ncbi:hypothetical protein FACS189452_06800 [Bacteroidia bacterium]|nr:hypothetical protein FACS189452_06800 [Bacteroidia bacterium]GHT81161.1 hypothetical protein FACS189467_4740 [Bacteroidia bacterium]
MSIVALQVGGTGDETLDAMHGKCSLNYYLDGDTAFADYSTLPPEIKKHTPYGIPTTQKYYGVGFEIIPAIALKLGLPEKYEYEFRHILCSWFGFLFMFFAGLIGAELQSQPKRRWQTACLSLLIIFFTPLIFGISLINTKDIPTAAGYAMAIWSFIRIYKTLSLPLDASVRFSQRIKWRDVAFAIIGIAIAVSVRIGGLMLPFYYAVGCLLLLVLSKNFRILIFDNGLFTFKFIGVSVLICIVGMILGLCLYPNFFYAGPITHIKDALGVMTKFPVRIPMLWDGKMIDSLNLPPYYLLKSFLYTIPLWVFAGAILFVLNIRKMRKSYSAFQLIFLIFTIVFPFCYLIIGNANLYNGWRHVTFSYCSFVPLIAIGFYETGQWFSKNKFWKILCAVILIMCIFPTAQWMVKNYKYTYAYYNTLVGDPYKKYDLDYHGSASVVGMKWLIDHRLTDSTKNYTVTVKDFNAADYVRTKNRSNIITKYGGVRAFAGTPCDYAILSIQFIPPYVLKAFFPPKGTIHVETINGKPICVVVEKNPLDAEGIRLVQQNRFSEGIEKLEQAYKYNPNNFGLWYWMGYGYYYLQKYDEAIKFFTQFVNFWATGEEQAFALSHIGATYVEKKQYDNAIPNLQNAERINNNRNPGLVPFISANLGIAYYNKKDYAKAVPCLEKCVTNYPHLNGLLQLCKAQAK